MINVSKLKNEKAGFTLIELLLYVGVVAFILSGVTAFLFMTLQARIKTQAMNEVNYQGQQIINLVSQTIRNAEAVNSPTKQNNDSSLSVDMVDSAVDPTSFNISGGVIQIEEDGEGLIDLTNSKVIASNLMFHNYGLGDAPDSIHFEFQLDYKNLESRNEYNYSESFYGSASIRK
ncbi:MAG: type II secretion system protein [Candidatus Moranbacteria bacterium]|nr:type II secretion system protein [Candidatus Moranbacteria bacterium]